MCIVIVVGNDPCKNVIKTSLVSCILCLRISFVHSFIFQFFFLLSAFQKYILFFDNHFLHLMR